MKEALATALKAKKAGDQRSAVRAMQQKKMLEKDLAKLDGQLIMLEQQKGMIEGAVNDSSVISSMKNAKNVIQQLNKQANVDDIADLKDELDDMMAENAEKQDYFAGIAREGEEDLLNELDELEADAAQRELEEVNLEPQLIKKIQPKKYVEEVKEEDEEEDEIKKLEKLMMA